jgi:inhibitor of cysteine peptidase
VKDIDMEKPLGPAENGQGITVKLGTVFAVDLPENPTTGYRWQVASDDGLKLAEDKYESSAERPGAGGVRHLRFQAAKKGDSQIHAELRRVWETEVPPVKTWSLRVRVQAR